MRKHVPFLSLGYPDVLISPKLLHVTNTTTILGYRLTNIKRAELSSLVVLVRGSNGQWEQTTNFQTSMADSGDILVTVSQLRPRRGYEFLVRPCNSYGCNPGNPDILVVTTLGKTSKETYHFQ